eukprot:gb/GECG01008658.1/.p1 GENE.gb/GECG01008658.1/~~gb/GECG01008658.1/.p1  ORF type:complete len:540 (+),score=99.51 gb/GECG01008658.1/:1-1620(+)
MSNDEESVSFFARCIGVPSSEPPVEDKAHVGIVEVLPSQKLLRWRRKDADPSQWTYTLDVSSLQKWQKRKNDVKFLTSGGSEYAFAVYSRDDNQQPSEEERERLRKLVKRLSSAPSGDSSATSTANGAVASGGGDSRDIESSSSSRRREGKKSFLRKLMTYEEELNIRKSLLEKNETDEDRKLRRRYEKLVEGKELTEDEFWAEREQLIFDEYARRRERALPSALPDERPSHGTKNVSFRLTAMQIRQMLVRDPALKQAYQEYCQSGAVTQKEFWTTYFRTREGLPIDLSVEDDKSQKKRREALQFFVAYKDGLVDDNGNILQQHHRDAVGSSNDTKTKRKQLSTVSQDVNLVQSLDDVAYSEIPSKYSVDPGTSKYSRTNEANSSVSNFQVDQWRGGFGTGEHARAYEGFIPRGIVGPKESKEISQRSKHIERKADRLIKEHNRYSGVVVEGGLYDGRNSRGAAGVSSIDEERINEELEDLRKEGGRNYLPLQVDKHKVMSHVTEQNVVPEETGTFHEKKRSGCGPAWIKRYQLENPR